MMIEKEKNQIRSRAKEPLESFNARETNGMNPPTVCLDDCNDLIDVANELILENKLDGLEILKLVDLRAIELEKILKNYE